MKKNRPIPGMIIHKNEAIIFSLLFFAAVTITTVFAWDENTVVNVIASPAVTVRNTPVSTINVNIRTLHSIKPTVAAAPGPAATLQISIIDEPTPNAGSIVHYADVM